MGSLTYTMITSADGFTADADGRFDWAVPTASIHRHVERLTATLSGQIYGPRMWETMKVWRDIRPGDGGDYGELEQEMYSFAETWRAIPAHVFSRGEGKPLTGDVLRKLKAASDGTLSIAGPGLAAVALREGLVDEVARYVVPVAVGGGTPWWPTGVRSDLVLLANEVLDAGWVYQQYRVSYC